MKTCTKCKIEKPKTEFSKKAAAKCGLAPHCRACEAEYRTLNSDKIAAYRATNREKIAARDAAYQAANRDKIAAYKSANRAANSAKIAARDASYYTANIEKIAARKSAYHAANPDKAAAHARNRRSRTRNAEGKHTAADVRAIFEAQHGLCANCETKLFKSGKQKFHVDHIMPLALGGSNWPVNLQCLCPSCNMSKGAKHPGAWAAENGRLI